MRLWIMNARRVRQAAYLAAGAIGAGFLLAFPEAAQNGVRHGLSLCGQLLIPSLFPFLVLSDFLIRSGTLRAVSRLCEPLMQRLFGFSGGAAAAVLLSMLGGYPAGAAAVAGLMDQGELSATEGRRLLRCAVNAGPAFVIGGIGVGMLASAEAGVWLLLAHWCASFLVMGIERRPTSPHPSVRGAVEPLGQAVVGSLHSATESLLSMCSFVLLASAVLTLADAVGGEAFSHSLWRCGVGGLLEVSNGCMEAAATGAMRPFLLGAMLGFGGLAVHGQIAAVTARHRLIDSGFFRARLLHALLGGTLSQCFFWWFPPSVVASTVGVSLSSVHAANDAVGGTALLTMMLLCVLFLMTLPKHRRERVT